MPNLVIVENAQEAAQKAANAIMQAIVARPRFVLGLATGSTPSGCYGELARRCQAGEVSFSQVVTFNLDEYWGLEDSHPQSYRQFMQAHLFDRVDIRPWNTHLLNGRAASARLECEAFEQKIAATGGVDLWLLGIGRNGHVAFNEPGSPVDSRTRLVALAPDTIAANSDGRFFDDPAQVPRCALSAGIGTIREARRLIMLATGDGKATALAAALEGPFTADCPASLLQDHPDFLVIADRAAASCLKRR